MLQEFSNQPVNAFVPDKVIVVQGQDKLFFNLIQFVYQTSGQYRYRRQMSHLEHGQGGTAGGREDALDCRDEIGEEEPEIVVILVQGHPCAGDIAGLQPAAHQGALAVTSRRRDQSQRSMLVLVKPVQ